MATGQISITLDEEHKKQVQRFKRMNGLKSDSGTISLLIHRGLSCTCSNGNNRGGVRVKQLTSTGDTQPDCFGEIGSGHCNACKYADLCAERYWELNPMTKQNK